MSTLGGEALKSTVRNTGDAQAARGGVANSGIIHGDVHVLSAPAARSAYLQQVRRMAPRDLAGRKTELAELAAFCTASGGSPYRWWQAPAWAGKSALMSWFVLHPPPGVQVVSFFVTARYAGQSDRGAFIDVVLEQLAEVAGQPLPVVLSEATREAHLLDMLDSAAQVLQEDGRRLALVVDGLDEDRGVTTGPEAYSIAALLPARPPTGVRVVVAGRPSPPVPSDVPHDHPLRDHRIVRRLKKSVHAQVIRTDAERELKRLLRGDPAGRDLLGLITAAGGGLSGPDLAELTGLAAWETEEHLHTVSGRTFGTRGSHWRPETGPPVYVLAHEELQNTALYYLGTTPLEGYRQRLHAWADRYRDRGWPVETPEYLLRGYHRLLQQAGDQARTVSLTVDQARHDRLLDVTGGDVAALTEISAVQRILRDHPEPDLLLLLRLAIVHKRLGDRNTHVPSELLNAMVRLGHAGRAENLVRSITDAYSRVEAVSGLVGTLVECGHPDEARKLAEYAERSARTITSLNSRAYVLTGLAIAVARCGDLERAHDIARAVPGPHRRARALAELAGSLPQEGDPDRARRLIDEAEEIARAVDERRPRQESMVAIAGVAGRHWDLGRIESLTDSITEPDLRSPALAHLANTVGDHGDPERAHRLIDEAEKIARTITDPHLREQTISWTAETTAKGGRLDRAARLVHTIAHSSRRAWTLGNLVETAVEHGDTDRAESLADTITEPLWQAWAFVHLAEAIGKRGELDRAEELARTTRYDNTLQRDKAFVGLVRAATFRGEPERAESLAEDIAEPNFQVEALAWLADAAARRGDLTGARRLVDRARGSTDTAMHSYDQAWAMATLAEVVAESGDPVRARQIVERAEELARTLTPPDYETNIVAHLVDTAAQYGDLDHAEALARTIKDDQRRAWSMAGLLKAAIDRNDMARAEKLADAITVVSEKAEGLARLAHAVVEQGDLADAHRLVDRAETTARTITEPGPRIPVLVALADAVTACGDTARARDLIDRAEQDARVVAGSGSRTRAVACAAQALDARGERERAELLISGISDPYRYALAMTDYVEAMAQRGDTERAEALAGTIDDYSLQGLAMNCVIRALISSGDLERAETLTRALLDEDRQAAAMSELAEGKARHGDLDRAESLARDITNSSWHVDALAAVAGLADPDRARRIIAELLSQGEWLKPLRAIAEIAPAAVTAIADEILAR